MRAYQKVFTVFFVLAIVLYVLLSIGSSASTQETHPQRIPSYAEVVPVGFQAPIESRALDVQGASSLLQPRLPLVRVADAITAISCPTKHPECIVRSMTLWVRNNVEHQDALLARNFLLSPEETIIYRQGSSATQSMLLVALLRAEGVEARLGSTAYVQFVEASYLDSVVRLDPACASCPFNATRYSGPEQNILWVE
ncbi:MAG: transglutaminase-like domain-containing protein [Candidatus Woesearchaeota archaeon]